MPEQPNHSIRWRRASATILALSIWLCGPIEADELTIGRHSSYTRVVLQTARIPQYDVNLTPGSIVVQIFRDGLRLPFREREVGDGVVQRLRATSGPHTGALEILLGPDYERFEAFVLEDPPRLVIDLHRRDGQPGPADRGLPAAPAVAPRPAAADRAGAAPAPAGPVGAMEPPAPAGAPPPPMEGEPPPAYRGSGAQGVQRVVIDPGHGGAEVGARGPGGHFEKDICLAVARRLQRRLADEVGLDVILTRDRDIEVPLTYRAELANNRQADLFISIHANAASGRRAHGAETYFLSDSGFDEETRALAALENNTLGLATEPAQLEDGLSLLLWELANKEYLRESRDLAEVIQRNFNSALELADRGVKQGRFLVLKGAAMPAVLVEVGFISNPEEERKLVSDGYQQKLADALFASVLEYKRRVDRFESQPPLALPRAR